MIKLNLNKFKKFILLLMSITIYNSIAIVNSKLQDMDIEYCKTLKVEDLEDSKTPKVKVEDSENSEYCKTLNVNNLENIKSPVKEGPKESKLAKILRKEGFFGPKFLKLQKDLAKCKLFKKKKNDFFKKLKHKTKEWQEKEAIAKALLKEEIEDTINNIDQRLENEKLIKKLRKKFENNLIIFKEHLENFYNKNKEEKDIEKLINFIKNEENNFKQNLENLIKESNLEINNEERERWFENKIQNVVDQYKQKINLKKRDLDEKTDQQSNNKKIKLEN